MRTAHRLLHAAAGFGLVFIAAGISAGLMARRWWDATRERTPA